MALLLCCLTDLAVAMPKTCAQSALRQSTLTSEQFEDYLLSQGGISVLETLVNSEKSHRAAKILNVLARTALQRMIQAYAKPVLTGEGHQFSLTRKQNEYLKQVSHFISEQEKSQTLNIKSYNALMSLILIFHDYIGNYGERLDLKAEKHEKREDYYRKQRKEELREEANSLEAVLLANLKNKDLTSHKGRLEENVLHLPVDLDFYSFLILGIDLPIQGIAAEPFPYYDGVRKRAREFNEHDDNHNNNFEIALGGLSDGQFEKLSQAIEFCRKYASFISPEDRFFGGALFFVYLHEAHYTVSKVTELLRSGKVTEERLDWVVERFLMPDPHPELKGLSEEQVKDKIAAALKRMSAAYNKFIR